jgi:hypothetical protein
VEDVEVDAVDDDDDDVAELEDVGNILTELMVEVPNLLLSVAKAAVDRKSAKKKSLA